MSLLTLIIERCGTHSEGIEKLFSALNLPKADVVEFPAQFPGHQETFGVSVSTGKHSLELGMYLPGEFAFERGTLRPYARHDLPVAHGWEVAVEKVWTVNWPATREVTPKPASIFVAPEFIFPTGLTLTAWPVPIGSFHGISCAQAEMLRLHPSDLQQADLEGLPNLLALQSQPAKYLVVLRTLALITSIQNFARYFCTHHSDRDGFIQWPFFSLLQEVLREETQEVKNELYFIAGLYLKNLIDMFDDVIIIGQGFDVAPQQQQLSMAFYYASNPNHRLEHIEGAQDINLVLKQRFLPQPSPATQNVVSTKLISNEWPPSVQAQAYLCKAEMERAVYQEEAACESYLRAHRLAADNPLIGFRVIQQSLELGKWQQARSLLNKFDSYNNHVGFRVLALFLSTANEEVVADTEIGICDTALQMQMQIASLICKCKDKTKAVAFYEKIHSCLTNDFIHAMALSEIRQIPRLNTRFASLVDKFPPTALTHTIKLQLMNEAMASGNLADLVRYNP